MTEQHDSNAQPQPATPAAPTTWDAPLHPLGHCLPDDHRPWLRTPLGYAATRMLLALGLDPGAIHLATLQQPGNSACHDYLAHDADYAARLALVQQDQGNHWSAFFRANGGPKNEHVLASAVVQIDFDGLTPDAYAPKLQALVDAGLPAPTLALCTGSGTSLHVYWRLQQPWPIADGDQQVGNLQKLICRHFDGDLHSTNPARMMRLAGSTYYAKKTGDPIGTAHVVWHDAANPNGYPFDTLWQWGQANPLPTRPATPYDPNECTRLVQAHANPTGAGRGKRYNEATRVAGSLERIDPDPYDDWIKVGMALHAAGYPLETWDSWAKGSPKYNGYEGHEQKWAGFGRYQGTPVTIATIVDMAKAADPSWLRPGVGTPTQQQLRQAVETALQDALPPPPPPPAGDSAPATPQTLAEALVAQAEGLRNRAAPMDDPTWGQVLHSVGLLQAQQQITALQVLAIKTCAEACGIGRQAFDRDAKTARDGAARQLAQERREQRAQEQQQRQQLAATPPGVQILGLTPDRHLVLLLEQGEHVALTPSMWRKDTFLWARLPWLLDNWPTPGDTPRPDLDACYDAWHAYAATLPPCPLDNIRKQGAHLEPDTGTIVWNTGRGLVVSPTDAPTYQADAADYTGQFHYIATGRSILPPGTQPLADAQGQHLLQLFVAMGWHGANDGLLAFGWTVLAPMGGALPYRPQLAYTAPSSGGKTWTRNHVMVPLLGGAAACSSFGAPSAAGMRGVLDGISLPLLADETENDATAGTGDWEEVLRLAYDGETKVMGLGGKIKQRLCAAVCTFGINQGTDTLANANRRVTVRSRTLPEDAWVAIEDQLLAACTVATGQALALRTMGRLRTIVANARAIERALRPTYHDKARSLRNVALLAAGAHSATTSGATLDDATALAWLQQVWDFDAGSDPDGSDTNQPDGQRLLHTLLGLPATLQLQEGHEGNMVTQHLSVRVLLALAQRGGPADTGPVASNAARARDYLWAKYGLGICQNELAGHVLWATGPAGNARQQAMARQEPLKKWAKGNDARDAIASLPGVRRERLRPQAGMQTTFGSNSMPAASGLAIPVALLAEPDNGPDVTQTQEPCDAPCDGPEPPPW